MTGISKGKILFDKYFLLASLQVFDKYFLLAKLIFIVDDSPEVSY